MNLLHSITLANNGDQHSMLELLKNFNPLLKKYSRYLHYEDSFYDLQLDFIELILNVKISNFSELDDRYILAYISKSIHNAYIKYSMKHSLINKYEINESELSDSYKIFVQSLDSKEDSYKELFIEDIKKHITNKEFSIITEHYFSDISIKNIADKKKISRQSINKLKKSAISKLKESLL